MAGLLDYLQGIGETGAAIGTGLLSGAVGAPYGVFKGVTSGSYGTPDAVRIAEEEAKKFMERNTYAPRGEVAQDALQRLNALFQQSKLPPVIPEAMALSSAPVRASTARMAENAAAPRQLGSQAGVVRMPGVAFDPRFDPRVKERDRLQRLTTDVAERVTNVPQVSLVDYAGRPFITSMADRTGVGMLNKINDVQLNRPVNMQGGQPFMFDNPGQVWASAAGPSKQILQEAEIIKQVTGQNPLFLPWRMAPTGGDFASMTGETMLSYADAAMNKTNKKRLDKMIKGYIPEWAGVSSDKAAEQFRAAPDRVRKALKNAMDVEFRDAGGLNIGEARLAVADPFQLTSRDTGLLSVGEVFADKPLIAKSGHAAYPKGVPGQGLGQLKEDIGIFELMPNVVQARGIPDPKNPRATDVRALQMKPYAGVLTDELLKSLGY